MTTAGKSASTEPLSADPAEEQQGTGPSEAGVIQGEAANRKYVVVHAGARDNYQLSIALAESGLLETLVTDLFWPADRAWARQLLQSLPGSAKALLLQRNHVELPSSLVTMAPLAGLRTLLLDRVKAVPFAWRRWSTRASDRRLGRLAGQIARRRSAGLLSYSYTGHAAFQAFGQPAMLFQAHPHPATMRRILLQELQDHPDCAASLQQEWELALSEREYESLVEETRCAARFLVASSFTRESLIENGVAASAIAVVPYGVDLRRFHPDLRTRNLAAPLNLLFVGRINQRKGIKYLLQALDRFRGRPVHLTVCGRVLDDLNLFQPYGPQITVRPSVSGPELVAAYQAADLFVFPSVGEGFGQVLLEALACGLPVLSTTRTAAMDLIQDGREGFVIEPRRADLIAGKIEWALEHRQELLAMREAARRCAETFTWARFRKGAVAAVQEWSARCT